MSLPSSPQEMPVDGASSTVPSQGQFGVAAVKPLSALAVTALVLGIISLLLSWVPILNNLIFILALIATVVAIVAVVQTRPNKAHRGSGMAITSLVISILAIVVVFGSQAMYSKAIDEAFGAASVTPSAGSSSSSSEGTAPQSPEASKAAADSNAAQLKNGKVTIEVKKVEKSVNDYEGKPTVAATLVITNNDTSNLNPFEYRVQAFQNKVELDTAIYFDAKPEGYEPMDALKELQPGGSMTVVSAFVLSDETAPVSLKIDSTFGSKKAFEKEYPLQ